MYFSSLWADKCIHSASAFCSSDIRFIACQLKYLSNIKLAVTLWKQWNARKYFSSRTQNNLHHLFAVPSANMPGNYWLKWDGVQTAAVVLCGYLVLCLEQADKNFQQWLFCSQNMICVPGKLLTIYKGTFRLLNLKTVHLGLCVLSGYRISGGGGSTTINTKAHNSCQPVIESQQLCKWWSGDCWIISLHANPRQGCDALS